MPSSKVKSHEQLRRCVENFDNYLYRRGHGNVWAEKIPQIEFYLKSLSKDKALPVNQRGDLNRSAILKQFGLSKNSMSIIQDCNPRLRELLDRYDTTAENPAYTQYRYSIYEDKLKHLLEDPELGLTYGRIVSHKWLTEKLGISEVAIKRTPQLNVLVKNKQREIDQHSRQGVTQKYFRINGVNHLNIGCKPYSDKHKRIYDFSRIIDTYGLKFTEKAATVFVSLISDLVEPQAYYRRIVDFFVWLAEGPHLYGELVADLRDNKRIDEAKFELAIFEYKETIQSRARRGSQSLKSSNLALNIIQKFADAGIFPRVRFHRTKRRSKSVLGSSRPSLVEAKHIAIDTKNITHLVNKAVDHFDIKFDIGKDAIAFAENLAVEMERREDLPKNLPQAVCVICEERLTALRISASNIFESWRKRFELGQRLINSSSHNGNSSIYRTLQNERSNKSRYNWGRTVSLLFPKQDTDLALRNLLTLIHEDFNGVCPSSATHEWGSFWTKMYTRLGGKDRVQAFLSPTHLVTSAVICLYLCESGANVAVAISMMADAIRPSKIRKHMTIVGNKARAKGKAIFDELPVEDTIAGCTSAAKAMSFYQTATERYQSTDNEQTKRLFLYINNSKVKFITEWLLWDDFSRIVAESKELMELKITPSMLRPTMLLVEHLKNPMNLAMTQIRARHENDTTTLGYVNKLPHRVIFNEKIREFQNTIQTIALGENKDIRNKLNIETKDWIAANDRARRTGLGIFCSDSTSGKQTDYPRGNICQALDRCLTCPLFVVVAEPESIADMIIWKEGLESAEEKFLDEKCERWEKVWIPWLAFFEVVLEEKMTRGELAKVKMEAKRLANLRTQSEGFTIPVPW